MSATLNPELRIEGASFPATSPVLAARFAGARPMALVIGIAGLALSAVGAFFNPPQFFFSYFFAYQFWLGLSEGCLVVVMIHYLTGGRWGYATRRFFEAGFMVLPVMLLFFIPVFFGLNHLYPWAKPEELAVEKILRERHAYLNPAAFIARAIFFVGVWSLMAWRLRHWSLVQDTTTDPEPTRKARKISGPGLVLYGLLGTFAYVDWIMALEKHWYSTMFAVIVMIGHILLAYAFSVLMLAITAKERPLSLVVTKSQYHQLGNLLLAFVMFWTYVSFGQFLIIYSGDKPHELEWYLHRIAGNWKAVIGALALFHFFIPFYLLLFRAMKKHITPLTILAAILFVAHIVHAYWLVMPAFHKDGLSVHWLDFSAPIGIGGIWIAAFLFFLQRAPLLPQHDPGLQFAFKYEE
jgi:hypothetical protein